MADVLLPPNATPLERGLEQAMAVYGDARDPGIADVWHPETCPPALLPWLAWALSIRQWDASWPVEVQRQAIADALAVHRIAGTKKVVKDALDAVGAEYVLVEQDGFLLRIEIQNSGTLLSEGVSRVRDQVQRVKRVSVHETIVVTGDAFATRIGLAAGFGGVVVGPPLEAR